MCWNWGLVVELLTHMCKALDLIPQNHWKKDNACLISVEILDLKYSGLHNRHEISSQLCILFFKIILHLLYIIQYTLKYIHVFIF